VTPGARVAATIEILEDIAGAHAADRVLESYFRKRRYAGSKDRAAISTQVFDILRRRASLAWGIERAGGAVGSRSLALAQIVASGADPKTLFTGQGHAPAALDAAETALAAALAQGAAAAPAWVAGNYPEWMDGPLRARFGEALAAEMAALNARAPVDLRVNALRASRSEILAEFAKLGIEATPTALSPLGLRLAGRVSPDRLPHLRDGLVEIQDEGSQLAALLVGARPGEQVVDLCAGGGGKALALAAAMGRRGQVYACDSDARRLDRLKPRAKRAEAHNIQPHVLRDKDPWLAEQAGKCHRVIVDAPCSGTGTWRRNPETRWRYGPAEVADLAKRQGALLDVAAPLLRPGGRLVYVVCSLLPAEGEEVAKAFLARHADFAALPARRAWAETLETPYPGDDPYLVLSPARQATDGFFVALFERRE
jgi:16S rRNA (cytosine967-C5)-methyltransferase